MPQDPETGAAGNAFGRETASKVAVALGAKMVGRGSNEALLDSRRIVIKCAREGTSSVGVTYLMLDAIQSIVGAFEQPDGTFELVEMPPVVYKRLMRPTRSKGPSSGRVGIVSRAAFLAHCQRRAELHTFVGGVLHAG